MKDKNTITSLQGQSMFEALFVALRREHSDTRILDILDALKGRGYGTDAIVGKVVKSLGPNAAVRVQRLIANAHLVTRTRYRMTRTRRFKIWMRGMQDKLEDTTERLRGTFQRG